MDQDQQTFNRLAGRRNLYLISQTVNNGYDTYSDAVVAAWAEEEARNIHPAGYDMSGFNDHTWAVPADVTAIFIGVGEPNIQGIICASFHAG